MLGMKGSRLASVVCGCKRGILALEELKMSGKSSDFKRDQ